VFLARIAALERARNAGKELDEQFHPKSYISFDDKNMKNCWSNVKMRKCQECNQEAKRTINGYTFCEKCYDDYMKPISDKPDMSVTKSSVMSDMCS